MVDPTNKSRTRTLWNANLANLPEPDEVALAAIKAAGEDKTFFPPTELQVKPKRGPTPGDNSVLLDKKIQNKLLHSLAKGTSIDSAMAEIGVSPRTFYYFKEKAVTSNNPEMHKLLQKVEVAYELGVRYLETQALKQSMFDPGMTKFLLAAKKPELYANANRMGTFQEKKPDDQPPAPANVHNTLLVLLQNSVTDEMGPDEIAEVVRRKFKQIQTFRDEKMLTLDEVNAMNAARKKK